MLRRSAFEAVGGFDEDRDLIASEDYDLWLRLLTEGRIDYLDEPLSIYRRGPWSLSDDLLFVRGVDKIMAKVLQSRGDRPELRRLIESRTGKVRIDAASQHTFKTPRIGKILVDGQFEVVWMAAKPVRPTPYPSSRTTAQWKAFLHDLYTGWGEQWAAPTDVR